MTDTFEAAETTAPIAESAAQGGLEPLVSALGARVSSEVERDAFSRDPDLVWRALPFVRSANAWYGSEVRGWDRLPADGPFLVVGNHSGGAQTPDLYPFWQRWVEDRGPDAELYALAYDLLFGAPGLGQIMRRLGVLPANPENSMRALERGAPVVVFPGGDHEVFRPWTQRNRIDFGGRTGFIKLAIAMGVPVVPMTIHGAHESPVVLTRGEKMAKAIGIDRLKVKVMPFVWQVPLGVQPAFVPGLPLPSKITVEMGEPIDWSHHGATRAEDPEVLLACSDEITGVMQETLDRLAAERPWPIMSRLGELWPSNFLRRGPKLNLVR